MKLFEYSSYALSWMFVGFIGLSGCVSNVDRPNSQILEQPNMSRSTTQVAAGNNWLDTKETVDNGNAPAVAGCQDVYTTQNTTCGILDDRWGDYCDSPNTHIMERVVGVQCANGRQARPVRIDCRQFLNNPQARCVEVPNVCPPGNFLTGTKSARCEIPGVPVPTPEPIPNPTIKQRP